MIIVPEIQKVLITPPRTGSTGICQAIIAKYPNAMWLYRHMEADGVPHGYDRWERHCIVRHPIYRLWSMYKYLIHGTHGTETWRGTVQKDARSHDDFYHWMIHGTLPFIHPYWYNPSMKVDPRYMVLHHLPEQRKSQWIYARPDLGTIVHDFKTIDNVYRIFGMEPGTRVNASHPMGLRAIVSLSEPQRSEVIEHMQAWFEWELEIEGYRL